MRLTVMVTGSKSGVLDDISPNCHVGVHAALSDLRSTAENPNFGRRYSGTPYFHLGQWATTSLMNGAEAAHRFNMAGS